MTIARPQSIRRVLDPIDRVSEVLFGLIMVLTFTGSLSVAQSGDEEVRAMLVGALGCNVAWGLIDAIMYLMGCLAERGTGLRILACVRSAGASRGTERLAASLPPVVVAAMTPADLGRICAGIARLPAVERPRLQREDWIGAVAVFLLVFASTIPVTLPFMLFDDSWIALRLSNVIAIAMMFATGYAFGRLVLYRPLLTGGAMVCLGTLLVSLTILLGG